MKSCRYSGKACDCMKECEMIINSQHDPNTYNPRFLMDMFGLECTFLDEQIDWNLVAYQYRHPVNPVMGNDVPAIIVKPEPKKIVKTEPKKTRPKKKRSNVAMSIPGSKPNIGKVRTMREIMIQDRIRYDVLVKKMANLLQTGKATMITPGKFRFNEKIDWNTIEV